MKNSTKKSSVYTKSCACLKGGFTYKFVCDPNKIPYSSQRPPQDCPKWGNLVDGLYCRHCALLLKKLKERKFSKDFLNTSKSLNDDSNVVSMPQELVVFNQEPGENFSQSPPQIDHHCCCRCGNLLDGIFCQRCTCKSCGKGAYYGYNCLTKVMMISNLEPCHDQNVEEFPQTLPSFHLTCYSGDENSFAYDSTPSLVKDSPNVFNPPSQPPIINDYMIELHGTFQAWLQQRKDQVYQNIPLCYDDDDDEESFIPLRDIIISELPSCIAFTPVVSTKDSLIMRDERLDTIPGKESDEFIKSSVENLIPNPSEFEDERDNNESFSDEYIPKEIYSNPLFDEEIISIKIDPHHLNAESDHIESLLNQDSSIISSSKIDSLVDEFAGGLILLKSIPPGIDEADCDPEEEIHLIEKLFDSLMEEIDLSLTPNDSIPPGIEDDDYDSERDMLILEQLLRNDSRSLSKNESFNFYIPSSLCPPAKPPDDDEIEPNSGILIIKVVGDISKHYVPMPRILPTKPTLALNKEKSPHLLSHRGLKAFQLSFESPMMIYEGNIPILDVSFFQFYPP
nr:hypothetical protein [Tanacetum cinerariifolium]